MCRGSEVWDPYCVQAMCNTFMGSFAYMAPERFNGQPYGFSSDIWSLGLCVVECITGKYPYEGLGTAPVPLMLAVRSLKFTCCLHMCS